MHITELNQNFWMVTAKAPTGLSVFDQKENATQKIINYGDDNRYPQELIKIVGGSPIMTACLDTKAKYLAGDGLYMVDANGKEIENEFTKKVLRIYNPNNWEQICLSWAWFEAVGFHFKFDLNGFIVEVLNQEFSTIRLGLPDADNRIKAAYLSQAWQLEKRIEKFKAKHIDIYDEVSTAAKIKAFADASKTKEFAKWNGALQIVRRRRPGQLYYPNPKYASALGWGYVDGQIQVFHSNAVDNSFAPGFILYIPFSLDGVDENGKPLKARMREEVEEAWTGAENGGKPAILYGPNKESTPQILPFTNGGTDKLYIALQNLLKENICIATSTPPVLANIPMEGGLNTNKEYVINEFDRYLNTEIKPDQTRLLEPMNHSIKKMQGYAGEKLLVSNSRPLAYIPDSQLNDYTEAERRESNGYAPKETEVINA